ncbi:MAG: GntR family transcriptional regulator [Oscillospiraceae bacterium]|nr:GntR family transcriptional regulator [Oscillospiraceae bacterium]
MNITISYTSDKPMYEQIEDGIKKAIYDGKLKNNELLPSVRQLAKDLNVSAITTKRAYIDLEHEGLVYTVSGKGTFVKLDKLGELQKGRQDELLKDIHNTASECKEHGIPKQAIIDTIDKAYAEGSEEV